MLNRAQISNPRVAGWGRFSKSGLINYFLGCFLYFYVVSQFYSTIVGAETFPTRIVILVGLAAFFIEMFIVEKKYALVYFIFFVVLSGYLVSAVALGRGLMGDAALILANAGMIFVLLRRRTFVPVMYVLFLILAGYFFYSAISGVIPGDVLAGSSNGVSWLMIQAVVLLYIVLDKEHKTINLLPAIIALALCVWSVGRSGIISSGLLVLGVAFFHFRENRAVLAALALALVGLWVSGLFDPLFELVDSYFWYFGAHGFDPHDRDLLISYYWNRLDGTSLLLGQDLTRDSLWQLWGFNPHNSYLLLHSWLGFATFPLMALILGAVMRSFFCRNKLYGLLLIALLLRALTDPLFFISTFDFLIYYLVVRIYAEPTIFGSLSRFFNHPRVAR